MSSPLRVLIVEDNEDDALLIIRELARGGYVPQHQRVDTSAATRQALETGQWDVIIADYAMPQFNGSEALGIVKSCGLDIPFIIVSGAIGEQTAVAAMKAGAHDYVMKSALGRLVPAIQRELQEAQVRRRWRQAEVALIEAHRRLQALSSRMMQIQETERRTLARELHDEIGQALTAVKIHLQALLLRSDTLKHVPQIEDSLRIVDGALEQVRSLSLDLRPSQLDDLGLQPALRWYLDRQSRIAGLDLQFGADALPARLHPDVETACFRIAQEAMTNVLRHAGAKRVGVELRRHGEELELTVEDDGKGFDVAAAQRRAATGASLGLAGMEERAALAGGRIELSSAAGRGTRVRVSFPLVLSADEPAVQGGRAGA